MVKRTISALTSTGRSGAAVTAASQRASIRSAWSVITWPKLAIRWR